jgi:hypothetical protein
MGLLLGSAGCYRNVPVELTQVAPGTSIRAHLTAVAQDRMRTEQAPGAGRVMLSGKLVRTTTDSVILGVESTVMEANVRTRTFYTDVPLLKSDVRTIELRQLDRRRTTLTVIGLGLGAIAGVLIALDYGGSSTGTVNPGPGVPETRIPLGIRIPFP